MEISLNLVRRRHLHYLGNYLFHFKAGAIIQHPPDLQDGFGINTQFINAHCRIDGGQSWVGRRFTTDPNPDVFLMRSVYDPLNQTKERWVVLGVEMGYSLVTPVNRGRILN